LPALRCLADGPIYLNDVFRPQDQIERRLEGGGRLNLTIEHHLGVHIDTSQAPWATSLDQPDLEGLPGRRSGSVRPQPTGQHDHDGDEDGHRPPEHGSYGGILGPTSGGRRPGQLS
jgi:hypothetical protein